MSSAATAIWMPPSAQQSAGKGARLENPANSAGANARIASGTAGQMASGPMGNGMTGADIDAGPALGPQTTDPGTSGIGAADTDVPPGSMGVAGAGGAPVDAGAPGTGVTTSAPEAACNREFLQQRAQMYFDAMAAGSRDMLPLHRSLRYTENGAEEVLGLGVWLRQPKALFARHVLDESRCSSLSEAVLLTGSAQKLVFGVRLRYVNDVLLEVEAHVVTPNPNYFEPDAIIVNGPDPWLAPVRANRRMTAAELQRVAERFFASVADPTQLPPSTPDCQLRQNGLATPRNGSCKGLLGNERFEQLRYPVIDTTFGVATAVVRRRQFIAIFMFKVSEGTIQDIETIGGASSATTGW